MNTPSHLIINAALRKRVGRTVDIQRSAFLLGAVLPDMPLWLLWAGTFAYNRYILGNAAFPIWSAEYDALFFTDPLWIATHNVLHAPPVLLIVIVLFLRQRDRGGSVGRWLFWFAVGCLLHTTIDILTHVDDGPLLFFPLDWSTRFQSPISYWDARYFGREFGLFELLLDLALLTYLLGPLLRRRLRREGAPGLEHEQ